MAEETPFGLSFGSYGDPRRYINKGVSPAKKVEQFVEKIKKSPLANLAGIMLADGGNSAAPKPVPAPALGQGVSVPTGPSIGASIPGAVAPGSSPMPQATPSVMPTQDLDGDGQIDDFWGVKSSSPQSSVNLQNPTDFNPLAPDTSNQMAVSPNDYMNIPGYGKLQKAAGQLMGMG
jgi:hypothetical protein